MIFNYDDLKRFYSHLKTVGNVVPMKQWQTDNAIILRHDVDLTVPAAYRMACIEKDQSIRSTFFFLVTAHSYNPFSEFNRPLIKTMADWGFEIGLHFDPTIYGDIDNSELQNKAEYEATMLESISCQQVESISLHNPSVHGQYPEFSGFNNAYDKRFFSDAQYLSDSRMYFRNKDPFAFTQEARIRPLQVLLHPLHFNENDTLYPDIYANYLEQHINQLDDYYQTNDSYAEQLDGQRLLNYLKAR
jgi:hypothetical protein